MSTHVLLSVPVAVSFTELLGGLGQALLVATLSFLLLALLASHFRFERFALEAARPESSALDGAARFQLRVADRMGTGLHEGKPFGVLLLARAEGHAADEMRHWASGVRAEDVLVAYDDQVVGLIMEGSRDAARTVAERLCVQPGLSGVVGLATWPANGTHARELVDAAVNALAQAGAPAAGTTLVLAEAQDGASHATPRDPTPTRWRDQETGLLRPERAPAGLQRYVAQFRREARPVSVLVAGMDEEPRLRKEHGNEGHALLIRGLAARLEQHIREDDFLARYDACSFVMALPCRHTGGERAAQRILEAIEGEALRTSSRTVRVRAKVGVARYPDHGSAPARLLEKAVLAQRAVQRGGSRVRVYDEALEPGEKRAPQGDLL